MTELTDHELIVQLRIDQAKQDLKVNAMLWLQAAEVVGVVTLLVGLVTKAI